MPRFPIPRRRAAPRLLLVQDGQLVHELLGLELLRDADDDVQDDDTADRVGNRRGGQTRKPQAAATTGTLSDSTR